MGLTAEIGAFLAEMTPERTPEAAVATVTRGFIDCIGVMIAGWDQPVARIVRAAHRLDPPPGEAFSFAPLIGAPPDRALAFAVAAHALDYDDTALGGHPSATWCPRSWPRHRRRARMVGT
jgi:2-methylcitrate dehydratase PrpD